MTERSKRHQSEPEQEPEPEIESESENETQPELPDWKEEKVVGEASE